MLVKVVSFCILLLYIIMDTCRGLYHVENTYVKSCDFFFLISGVRRLIIVEAGTKRVEGIVSLSDIFKFLINTEQA